MGLAAPPAVMEATNSYRQDSDVIGRFLAERTQANPANIIRGQEMYAAYKDWCEANGEHPWTKNKAGRKIEEHGFKRDHARTGVVFLGVELISQAG